MAVLGEYRRGARKKACINRNKYIALLASVAAMAMAGSHVPAHAVPAQQTFWTGMISSDWNDNNNWTSGVPTSSSTLVKIPSLSPPLPPYNNPVISGVSAQAGQAGAAFYVGSFPFGAQLSILNAGTLTTGSAIVGNDTNAGGGIAPLQTGTVLVDGAGSKWTSVFLTLGFYGQGTLNITNGGEVNANTLSMGSHPNSAGYINISGSDSKLITTASFHIGAGGAGTVMASQGAKIASTGTVALSVNPGSYSLVELSDAGTHWNIESGNLLVGQDSTGTFKIKNGAVV